MISLLVVLSLLVLLAGIGLAWRSTRTTTQVIAGVLVVVGLAVMTYALPVFPQQLRTRAGEQEAVAAILSTTPAHPLTEGRLTTETEHVRGDRVAVINEVLSRRLYPDGDAVGSSFQWADEATSAQTYVIVGVVSSPSSARPQVWIFAEQRRELFVAQARRAVTRPWSLLVSYGPIPWGLLGVAVGLSLVLPRSTRSRRVAGAVVFVVSLGLVAAGLELIPAVSHRVVFWLLAAVTLVSAVGAVSMPSAVYCAVWFALSLLGVAALLLFQGAQFLGVATVVVYAGAIVVTFLFVVMLAQPDGLSSYDRISWGRYPKFVSPVAAALLVGTLTALLSRIDFEPHARPEVVLHPSHMARFGSELFSRQLISVELAGTLLLVALVGAVSILMHGNRTASGGQSR